MLINHKLVTCSHPFRMYIYISGLGYISFVKNYRIINNCSTFAVRFELNNNMDNSTQNSYQALVKAFVGTEDIMSVEYIQFDESMGKSSFDLRKVRGSVRLAKEQILTPADEKRLREEFVNMQIP